jgi:F0F1-type ATP synthase assembly protein I
MDQSDGAEKKRNQRLINLTLAGVVGQVGCLTLVIILAALFLGLWLDNQFQTRPLFTLILIIASIPVSLAAMFVVVRFATKRIKHDIKDSEGNLQEVKDLGNNP